MCPLVAVSESLEGLVGPMVQGLVGSGLNGFGVEGLVGSGCNVFRV